MDLSMGRSKAEFAAVISEAEPRDRISHPKFAETHSVIAKLGYPASTRQD